MASNMARYGWLAVLLVADRLVKLASLKLPVTTSNGIIDFELFINANWLLGQIGNFKIISLIIFLLLLGVVVLFVLSFKRNDGLQILGWGLVLIGGTSNYWDRFWYGGVIDFINILDISHFNFSDVYIICGVIFLIFSFYKHAR